MALVTLHVLKSCQTLEDEFLPLTALALYSHLSSAVLRLPSALSYFHPLFLHFPLHFINHSPGTKKSFCTALQNLLGNKPTQRLVKIYEFTMAGV